MLWDGRWLIGRAAACWPQGPSERDSILRPGRRRTLDCEQRNQLALAVVASLGYLSIGLVRGWSSPGVPSMRELDPQLLPTPEASSWVSSIPPLGAFVGSLVAGPLLQRAGRKRTLVLSAPLCGAAWLLVALAPNYAALLAGRILTGFYAGVTLPSAQVYVSECSHPEIRGVLGSLPALFMSAGILVGYLLGAWLPWRALAGASAVCPAVLLLLLLPLPESPSWLAGRGRDADAVRSLRWLRRPPRDDIQLEERAAAAGDGVFTVQPADKAAAAAKEPGPFSRKALLRRPVLLPFGLSLMLMMFQQFSGIDSIIFYTVDIFRSSGSSVNDHLAAILVAAVQLAANVAALFVVDRAGRRPLLIASGVLMAASMAALGAYFHLKETGRAAGLGLLPLASLLVFMVGFSVGYCTLPYLMMGEILPVQQRSMLSSVAGSLNLGTMFVVIKTFHNLTSSIGNAGAFWLYAACCVCSCVFVGVLVPETKGKSLEEIEEYFEQKNLAKKRKKQARKEKKEAEATANDRKHVDSENGAIDGH